MTQNKTDLAVFIGRFQPPHNAHIATIKHALTVAERVLVIIGSAYKPADIKNPFNQFQRKDMIEACLTDDELAHINFEYVSDNPYNDAAWIRDVQRAADQTLQSMGWKENTRCALIGHRKDYHTSVYLDMFPTYGLIEMPYLHALDATTVRELLFAGQASWRRENRKRVAQFLPEPVLNHLDDFVETIEYDRLCKESEFIRTYKLQWANSPYPPTFVTTDAVVVNMGHILLVQRKSAPGQGLWALPGGFIGQYETVAECVIRELVEETKIKVPTAVLKGSIRKEKRYDHPGRSTRGRTITTAFLIELHDRKLPKVKGADDAMQAKWFSLNDFINMQHLMFEDHYHIITDLLGLG